MTRGLGVMPKTFSTQVVAPEEVIPGFVPKGQSPPAAADPGEPASPAALPAPEPKTAAGKPALSVKPPGGTPPVPKSERDGDAVSYSLEEIARECFGPAGSKQEYLDLVACAARDAGYAVGSSRAEVFSKEQADWIAADSLRRPRPIERFELNGHDREAARHG